MKKIIIPLLIAITSYGYADTVKSEINKTKAYLGETLVYRIVIETDQDIPPLDIIEVHGADVEYAGRFPLVQSWSVNGKEIKKTIYFETFNITPQKTGKFRIPGRKLNIGGKEYTVERTDFIIEKPVKNKDYSFRINFNKSEIFSGETVIADMYWYFSNSAHTLKITCPYSVLNGFHDESIELDYSPEEKQIALMYNNEEIRAAYNPDKKYVRLKRRLIAGESEYIDASKILFQFDGVTGYRQTFGGLRQEAVYNTFVIPGEGKRIKITALPELGKPADFSGIVGNLDIELKANPVQVQVGEPITLQIIFRGDIYNDFDLPKLEEQKILAENFSFPFSHSKPEKNGSEMIFIQTIRPKNSSIKEIPPIRLSYFDSEKKQYSICFSNNIDVTVLPVSIAGADDMKVNSRKKVNTNPELNEKGIRHNYDINEITTGMKIRNRDNDILLIYFTLFAFITAVFLILYFTIIIKKGKDNEKKRLLTGKGYDYSDKIYAYIFHSLKIEKHSNLLMLRKQIDESAHSEEWKKNTNNLLDVLLNYKISENEKKSSIDKLMTDLADMKTEENRK